MSAWRCPKCDAPAGRHGRGGNGKCKSYPRWRTICEGLICECDDQGTKSHGLSFGDRCENAVCNHCGWVGALPIAVLDGKKLKGWAKKALDAGWTPPKGWTP